MSGCFKPNFFFFFLIISFRSIEFAWSAHPPDGLPTVPTDLAVQKILIGIHYYQYVNTLSKSTLALLF